MALKEARAHEGKSACIERPSFDAGRTCGLNKVAILGTEENYGERTWHNIPRYLPVLTCSRIGRRSWAFCGVVGRQLVPPCSTNPVLFVDYGRELLGDTTGRTIRIGDHIGAECFGGSTQLLHSQAPRRRDSSRFQRRSPSVSARQAEGMANGQMTRATSISVFDRFVLFPLKAPPS